MSSSADEEGVTHILDEFFSVKQQVLVGFGSFVGIFIGLYKIEVAARRN